MQMKTETRTMRAESASLRPGEKLRKVIILGFPAVGKSALCFQYVQSEFVEYYDPTIQQTFRKRTEHRGRNYSVEIVDSAGQDEFSPLNPKLTMASDGYVLVYSVDNRSSFEVLKTVNDKLLNAHNSNGVPRILVGTKNDLCQDRQVSQAEGQALAAEWECPYLECSAKENDNVDSVFSMILDEIEKRYHPEEYMKNLKSGKKDGKCIVM